MEKKSTNETEMSYFIEGLQGPFTHARFNFQRLHTNPQNLKAEDIPKYLDRCRDAKVLPFATGSAEFTKDSLSYSEKLMSLAPRTLTDEYPATLALQQRVQGFKPYQFSFHFRKTSFPEAFDRTFKKRYDLSGDLLSGGYRIREGVLLYDPNNTGSTDLAKVVEISFVGIPEGSISISAPEELREYEQKLLENLK